MSRWLLRAFKLVCLWWIHVCAFWCVDKWIILLCWVKEPGKGGLLFALSLMSIAKNRWLITALTTRLFARHNHAYAFAMLDVTISTCLIACRYITCVAEGSATMHISQSLLAALMRLIVSCTQALSVTQQLWAMLSLACLLWYVLGMQNQSDKFNAMHHAYRAYYIAWFKRHSCLMLLIAAYISRSSAASYWMWRDSY